MRRLIYAILVGLITSNFYTTCYANIDLPQTVYWTSLADATVEVILTFFITKTTLISISQNSLKDLHNLEQSDIITDILHKTKTKITVCLEGKEVTSQVPVMSKRKYNIIFIDNYDGFRNVFTKKTIENYDVTGYYLIVITAYYETHQLDMIEKIYKIAWKLYIININVLIMSPRQKHLALMYTYFPYTNKKCGDTTPVLLDTYTSTSINGNDLYPSKLKDMHQCPISVAALETPPFLIIDQPKPGKYELRGFEGDLLNTLAKRLNFHLNIIIPDEHVKWGVALPNGTQTGAIKMITDHEVNLTIGSWGITQLRLSIMDATVNYFQSDLVFVVPPGEPYSSFEKLFLPFESLVWIMIVLQFLFSVIVILVLKMLSKSVRNFVIGRNNTLPLLSVISIFLGGPMCYIPGRNFARTLAMIWILGSLVIRSSYQGSLYNYLQVQKNYSTADSIEKMIERDFKFYLSGSSISYLDSIPDISDRIVTIDVADRDDYCERLRSSDFKGVILSSREHVAFANYQNRSGDAYHVGQQHVMLFPVTLYVCKGSYLTAQLDQELSMYMSSGLILFWKNAIVDDRYFNHVVESSDPIPLDYDHIAGGFHLCLILMGVSLIVFGFEVFSRWVKWIKKVFDFLTY